MKHSKSSMFLMELIIAILFFSLASAVCIQLFAQSHLISRETVNQNYAISHAQSLAEIWYATEGDPEKMQSLLKNTSTADGTDLILMFDKSWQPISPENPLDSSTFYIRLINIATQETGDHQKKAKIHVIYWDHSKPSDSPHILYTLELIQHTPIRRGEL